MESLRTILVVIFYRLFFLTWKYDPPLPCPKESQDFPRFNDKIQITWSDVKDHF